MQAHYFQHVPFEGLGCIGPWLAASGFTITRTAFFEPASLPPPGRVDFLVVMGGPMSVNDESEYPWLVAEKCFIRQCIEAGTPVLGICLGAQLIASAMGARVYRNACREIGWFPIQAVESADPAAFRFPPSIEAFHWHGETFELPPGAIHLARSQACENQAFQLGRRAIGLQFHLETTPETARDLVAHCRDELQPSRYVQSEKTLLNAPPANYQKINSSMAKLLAYLTSGTGR